MNNTIKIPHVVILVETSREYGRGLLRGISRYVNECGPWSMYFEPHGLGDPPPAWLPRWSGDGILVRINDWRMAKAIMETGLPVVDMRNIMVDVRVPRIGPDNFAVSKMALDHLLERGFRHFGFCSMSTKKLWFLNVRGQHFKSLVEDIGCTCSEFRFRQRLHRTTTWEQEQQRVAAWLGKLPKPVGIMAGNDDVGRRMVDACLRAEIKVPDEVAIIGVDNDENLCNMTTPSLSSIDVNVERIGYEAADLLSHLMAGRQVTRDYTELPPKGVIIRGSTDVLAIDNREMVKSLRFIREHACDPINVEHVLEKMAVSRSSLERLFKKHIGHTPKEEIVRVQINRAKELLTGSDLSLSFIAEKSGFASFSHFSKTFKKHVGTKPREYRQQFKPSRPSSLINKKTTTIRFSDKAEDG